MEKYGTLIFLLFSSFLDIRKREISIPVTLLFGLAGVAYSIKTGRTMTDYLIPAAIGIFIFACSILTRGTGRYGRRMASYGTGMYDANGKLHSDGLHWNAACGGMFRYPVAGVSKE